MSHSTLNALLSVYTKDSQLLQFASFLIKRGYVIYGSEGTVRYLREHDIDSIDVQTLTGVPPILSHRVVTLAPQVHAGLIATTEQLPELEEYNYVPFDLLYVTLYPLAEELENDNATVQTCIDKTDIGGPGMLASACKSRRTTVVSDPSQVERVSKWIHDGCPDSEAFRFKLEDEALHLLADYADLSAEVRRTHAFA